MNHIGGFWPEVQFLVDVVCSEGVAEVVCSVGNVPFAGTWNKDTNDVSVACVWSDRELKHYLENAQQWGEFVVVPTQDEQLHLIDGWLNVLVKENPWNWLN